MQQHPVPQNISSYEFKLVGDMTLKQFFQIAGGVVIALIFYATPLPGFIKWPLILIFGGLGAALAFLPFEGRPLSDWIFAFIKAIYSPTLYVYSAGSVEDIFAKETASSVPAAQGTAAAEYLSQPAKSGFFGKFEQAEKAFMQKMTVLFQTSTASPTVTPVVSSPQTMAPFGSLPLAQGKPVAPITPAFKVQEELSIPQNQAVKVSSPTQHPQSYQPAISQPAIPVAPVFSTQAQPSSARQAVFMPDAGPPLPPDRPNTVVGQVLTQDGKIIDGAILEIRDINGKPVRAIRTNKVGHFLTVTPLTDGEYEIQTEKEGFAFDNVKFRAESKTIEPILIKSK